MILANAVSHFGGDEEPEYYHASPWELEEGAVLRPGAKPANFDNDRSGTYNYLTPHHHRAEQYHYHLWEQGYEHPHIYQVRPHGRLEQDPHDEESFRTKGPVTVEWHVCAHDED